MKVKGREVISQKVENAAEFRDVIDFGAPEMGSSFRSGRADTVGLTRGWVSLQTRNFTPAQWYRRN